MRYEVRASINAQPLAAFQQEKWADEWRHNYCNTGLVIDTTEWCVCEPTLPHGLNPEHRIQCECGVYITEIEDWDGGKVICEGCAAL